MNQGLRGGGAYKGDLLPFHLQDASVTLLSALFISSYSPDSPTRKHVFQDQIQGGDNHPNALMAGQLKMML